MSGLDNPPNSLPFSQKDIEANIIHSETRKGLDNLKTEMREEDNLQKEIDGARERLMNTYPEYTYSIDYVVAYNKTLSDYIKGVVEKGGGNNIEETKRLLTKTWQENTMIALKTLEKEIVYIHQSVQIQDKPNFLKYFVQNISPMKWESKAGLQSIEKISILSIYKGKNTNNDIALCELLKVPFGKLEKLDALYRESKESPEKKTELLNYIKTDLKEFHNELLALGIYKELIIDDAKKELGLEKVMYNLDPALISFSNIKDSETKNKIGTFLKGISVASSNPTVLETYIADYINKEQSWIIGLIDENIHDAYYVKETLEDVAFESSVKGVNALERLNQSLYTNAKTQVETLLGKKPELYPEVERIKSLPSDEQTGAYIALLQGGRREEVIQPPSPNEELLNGKYGKNINALCALDGVKLKENGELTIDKPIHLGPNGHIEVGRNGELLYVNTLGYTFKFDKNLNKSAKQFFEIQDQTTLWNKLGFGFFGENFKKMVETIESQWSLLGNSFGITISEERHDFLDEAESNRLLMIFKTIGFVDSNVNASSLINQTVTKIEFDTKISTLSKQYGENMFFSKSMGYNEIGMKRILIEKYMKNPKAPHKGPTMLT